METVLPPHRPSLLADLMAAESVGERQRTLKAVLHAMGFDWLGYGCLSRTGRALMPLSFCTTYVDPMWPRHYFAQSYHEVDPRLQTAMRSSLPSVWTIDELDKDANAAGSRSRMRQFVDDLAGTGMHGGAMFMLPGNSTSERHVVSLLSRTSMANTWLSDSALGQLLTLGLCVHEFHTRYRDPLELVDPADAALPSTPPRDTMNPVQRDILARVARGSSDKQIAYEMHLSSHAVDYHMRQLRRRFSVRNRLQLTQAALRSAVE